MPQTQSAKKALRHDQQRRRINNLWRQRMRARVKTVRDAITAKDSAAAQKSYTEAQKNIDRAARHYIIHRNTAARKKSRLQQAITKISAP